MGKCRKGIIMSLLVTFVFGFGLFLNAEANSDNTNSSNTEEKSKDVKDKKTNTQIEQKYIQIAKNEKITLYLNEDTLAIKILDNATSYMWSSVIESNSEDKNNKSWSNFMSSGIAVEYFEKDKPNASRIDLVGAKKKEVKVTALDDGFKANILLNDVEIGFEMIVKINGNELNVEIANDSITEGEKSKLASIYVYPFLGSTKKDEVDGYMFVPDGSGALIHFQDNQNKYKLPYEAKIYGNNESVEASTDNRFVRPPQNIKFPVFGIVHEMEETNQSVFAIVEKGQYNSKIVAYPNGVNTQYNWVTANYIFRQTYLQPTSRSLGGIVVYENEMNDEDIQIKYIFDYGNEANYVGMAKTYQTYLVNQGVLKKNERVSEDIPLRIDFLGAESENGLFFKKIIPMTTVDEIQQIIDNIEDQGIKDLMVIFKGWNKGGFSGMDPIPVSYEKKLGSKNDFNQLIESFKKKEIPLYFYNNYSIGYKTSSRFSERKDAAKKIDQTILEKKTYKDVYESYYYSSSQKTNEVIGADINKYKKQDISMLAVDGVSHILFSEMKKNTILSRSHNASQYINDIEKIDENMDSVIMYEPNDYMLKYADAYLDIPMETSKYVYIDEAIPFIQIVLKGYMNYYAPYFNFSANQQEDLLRLAEFGAYPSYFITHEPSYLLKHTNSNDLFTSSFSDWNEKMINTYQSLNDVLKKVENATIEDRVQVSNQVVVVQYSNGFHIIVNYGNSDFEYAGVVIPAKGYKAVEVN